MAPVAIPVELPDSWEHADQLTPVGDTVPDAIEEAAVRIERRSEAIRRRPGPTPALESVTAAITIHGVNASLEGVKTTVAAQAARLEQLGTQMTQLVPVLLSELTKDRDLRRQEEHLRVTSTIDVDTMRDKTEIEVSAATRKARLDWVTRILAIAATLAAVILAIVQTRHC